MFTLAESKKHLVGLRNMSKELTPNVSMFELLHVRGMKADPSVINVALFSS